jgi:hypothetical protein
MAQPPSSQSPFLGGGPKFNQAGNNAPLPGEKRAETPPPPPFGGPRMWIGGAVLLALLLGLYLVYGGGLMGTRHVGGRGGTSASTPNLNPDAPQ